MVDPTKGIGPLQGIISGTRVTDSALTKRPDESKEAGPTDEVNLSPEAVSLSQAEKASVEVRDSLAKYTDVSLTSGQNFDESL